ncbi:2-phosphoglycolate phosphatase [Pleurotus eryngii]|uniref:4-nitrophenylphosphatase n=1 Tax=Pleurotus eryngii TaxID=5323 RepID=A0A9P6D8H0_PLEER|nr:2-phosphoglycolate phosphatase [Pleurotus eryngii]
MSTTLSSDADYAGLLDRYDVFMFDCDGVLWQGDELIDGAVEVLALLRRRKKQIVFVTNNATKSRKTYKKKFDHLGVEAHVDEIYGSAFASAVYISSVIKLPKDKKVFVIGMEGMEEELRDEGISYIGGTDPEDCTFEPLSLTEFKPDPSVGAVICGLDTHMTYRKLSKAFQYLTRNPECHFLASNEDSTYPVAGGRLLGAGAISAPLRFALGKDPISIGKPATTMLDCIKAKIDFDPKRTIMIGDRLNTDILFGQNGGLATLLVLTGITSEADISGPNASPIVPDFVTRSIGDLRVLETLN